MRGRVRPPQSPVPGPFSGGCARAATAFRTGAAIVPTLVFGNRRILRPRHAVRTLNYRGIEMKKLVLALTALAAFTGSALAADLPARTYTKAPEPLPAPPSWTGFYIFGGGGGGI